MVKIRQHAPLNRYRRVLLAVASILLPFGPGSAQEPPTSPLVLFSVVSAQDDTPVEGALLELASLERSTLTDSLGRASFSTVPLGSHVVRVRHFAFAERTDTIRVAGEAPMEFRISVAPRAIAVEPIRVEVTGRDPFLVRAGFYDRQGMVESGYFATISEIESYTMFNTLFTFQRDLSVRLSENLLLFLNGLPADRFGYRTVDDLNEIPFKSVRGVEAYPCNEAPAQILRWFPVGIDLTKCNAVNVWTR